MLFKLRYAIVWQLLIMLVFPSCVKPSSQSFTSSSPDRLSLNPKADLSNVCSIFQVKPHWYYSAVQARKKWNIPVHVAMAFIKQESGFKYDARPTKASNKRAVSSAYGYSQALKGTWQEYRKETNNLKAQRDSFADAFDFIGWYNHRSSQALNIKKWQTYHLYLAYHEGITGYQQKLYEKKDWLKQVAKKVEAYSYRYYHQLNECDSAIKKEVAKIKPNKQPNQDGKTKQVLDVQNKRERNQTYFKGCGTVFFFWTTPCD